MKCFSALTSKDLELARIQFPEDRISRVPEKFRLKQNAKEK